MNDTAKEGTMGSGEIVMEEDDLEKFVGRGQVVPHGTANSPAELMRIALTHGESLERIEKMLALQIKYEENEARKAYYDAVAKFKENPPALKKDKFNKQFGSWYVGLGNLLATVSGPLGEVGLSISFPTPKQDDKSLTVESKLSHRLGHSETVSMTGPLDAAPVGRESGKAARNPLQNLKSTFTYLRSATCEAVLGIAGTDASQNDDGNLAGGVEYITDKQQKTITDLIAKAKSGDLAVFLKWAKIESLDKLPVSQFGKAVAALKAKV